MTDVTGGTPPTGGSEFKPHEHIAETYQHFGDAAMFAVANAAALPSSGNWVGRHLMASDTGFVYAWDGAAWSLRTGDSGWDALTMANGWVAFGGAYEAPESRLLNGIVFVHGTIKNGTTSPATTVTTLPAGRRPGAYIVVPLASSGHAAEIAPTGEVRIGANAWSATRTEFTFSFAPDQ